MFLKRQACMWHIKCV